MKGNVRASQDVNSLECLESMMMIPIYMKIVIKGF